MSKNHSLDSRHFAAIHFVAWGVLIGLIALDGNLDLPQLFSVPVSAYAVLIGVPLVVAMSFRRPVPTNTSPELLRRFLHFSPFGLTGLWLISVVIALSAMLGHQQVKDILP